MKENSLLAKKIENAEKVARDERVKKFLEDQAAAVRLRQAMSAGFKEDQSQKKTAAQRNEKYAAAFKSISGRGADLAQLGWKFSSTQPAPQEKTTKDIYINAAFPGIHMVAYQEGFYLTNGISHQPSKEWRELGQVLQQFKSSPMSPKNTPQQRPNWVSPPLKEKMKSYGWIDSPDGQFIHQKQGLVLNIYGNTFMILKDGKLVERGNDAAALSAALDKIK